MLVTDAVATTLTKLGAPRRDATLRGLSRTLAQAKALIADGGTGVRDLVG
jgi:hypothetical protein